MYFSWPVKLRLPEVCICNTGLFCYGFSFFRHRYTQIKRETLAPSLACNIVLMHTLEESLWSVWIVVFNEPWQTRPSAITKYANIARLNRFYQFFALFISFSLCRKRSSTLSVRQTSSPYPPARYLKTLYTDNLCYLMMHFQDGRLVIVGAQRVQVRSSRSRIRITLSELSSIWLGGRGTPPHILHFVFTVFFYFFSLLSWFLSSFFLFPTFFKKQFYFSGHFVNC